MRRTRSGRPALGFGIRFLRKHVFSTRIRPRIRPRIAPRITPVLELALALALALGAAGCDIMAGGGTEVGNPESMVALADDASTAAYLKDAHAGSLLPEAAYAGVKDDAAWEGHPPPMASPEAGAGDYLSSPDTRGIASGAAPRLRADSPLLYAETDAGVTAVMATPAEAMALAGTIAAPGTVEAVYSHENTLAVIYTPTDGAGAARDEILVTGTLPAGTPYWIPANARTGVLLADVSDPYHPRLIQRVEADGVCAAWRADGARLTLVTQFLPALPDLRFAYDPSAESPAGVAAANRPRMHDLSADDLLPHYRAYNAAGALASAGRLVTADNLFRPGAAAGGSIATLWRVDLDRPEAAIIRAGMAADIHAIHLTADGAYLAACRWRAESAAGFVTDVFRWRFDANGLAPAGAASLAGRLLDRGAMGGDAQRLFLATVADGKAADAAPAPVFIWRLAALNDALAAASQISVAGGGFQTESARFDGDLGYLIRADGPPRLIDLADTPRTAGVLPLYGQTLFARPIAGDRLLTLSRSPEQGDFILTLLDIADPDAPEKIDAIRVGPSEDQAGLILRPADLTYDAATRLLALPAAHYRLADDTRAPFAETVRIYEMDPTAGIRAVGALSPPAPAAEGANSSPARAIFMDGVAYAAGQDGIHAAHVADGLTPAGSIHFPRASTQPLYP